MGALPRTVRSLLVILVATLLLAVVAIAWVGERRARLDARADRLSARLDRDVAKYRAGEWERPVLRGRAVDGNAAAAQRAAVDLLGPIDRNLFGAADRAGPGWVPDLVRGWLAAHGEGLARLRAATQRTRAWTPGSVTESAPPSPEEYGRTLASRNLLFALASSRGGDECLSIVADIVRLCQDAVPGGESRQVLLLHDAVRRAVNFVESCTRHATEAGRARSAAEFESLFRHGPPIGDVLEREALFIGASLRRRVLRVPPFPRTRDEMDRIRFRALYLDSWEEVARRPARFRGWQASRYPDVLKWARREDRRRRRLRLTWVSELLPLIEADATARAYLGLLSLGLARRSPAASRLRDPFSGSTFRRHGEILVSVGPNGREEVGSPDSWTAISADDVAVLLP